MLLWVSTVVVAEPILRGFLRPSPACLVIASCPSRLWKNPIQTSKCHSWNWYLPQWVVSLLPEPVLRYCLGKRVSWVSNFVSFDLKWFHFALTFIILNVATFCVYVLWKAVGDKIQKPNFRYTVYTLKETFLGHKNKNKKCQTLLSQEVQRKKITNLK